MSLIETASKAPTQATDSVTPQHTPAFSAAFVGPNVTGAPPQPRVGIRAKTEARVVREMSQLSSEGENYGATVNSPPAPRTESGAIQT